MDNKLTKDIQDWLNAMPEQQDIAKGALMLLQLNRNRILYQNILRNPVKLKSKLVYELQKHLNIRLDGMTTDDVARMDKHVKREIIPNIVANVKTDGKTFYMRGQRPDHDRLPKDIQQLWFDASDKTREMRSIHERLKTMENARPCDRYPYLKQLIKMHDEQRRLYNAYDDYGLSNPVADAGMSANIADPEALSKALKTYRGYVVVNIDKLKTATGHKAEKLRKKMQERFDECKRLNIEFSDETIAELKNLGIE